MELPKLLDEFENTIFDYARGQASHQAALAARAKVEDALSRSPVVGAVGGEPLTDKQIVNLAEQFEVGSRESKNWGFAWHDYARAIEAHHGIGVSPTGSPEGEVSNG